MANGGFLADPMAYLQRTGQVVSVPSVLPPTTMGLGGGTALAPTIQQYTAMAAGSDVALDLSALFGQGGTTPLATGAGTTPAAGADVDEDWGWLQGLLGGAGGGGAAAGIAGALGLGTAGVGLAALLGSRIKFPWQTPAGEGFIAPWTGQEQITDPATGIVYWGQKGKEYFTGNGGVTGAMPGGGKYWTNASRDGKVPATVEFVQTADGWIYSRSLIDGSVKRWRPKKHIVISSNPRMSQIRKLDRAHKRVEKMVRKYAPPRRKSTQAPSAFLSAAERKLLKQGVTS